MRSATTPTLTTSLCCGMYQNHPFFSFNWRTSVAPSSSGFGSRLAPLKYDHTAAFFSFGSITFSFSRLLISELCPLASTITFGCSVSSVPSPYWTRTPVCRSPSNETSRARASSRTSTPCSRALMSIMWSNSLRSTCHVWVHSCGLFSKK